MKEFLPKALTEVSGWSAGFSGGRHKVSTRSESPRGNKTMTSGKARYPSVPGRGGVHSLVGQSRQRSMMWSAGLRSTQRRAAVEESRINLIFTWISNIRLEQFCGCTCSGDRLTDTLA